MKSITLTLPTLTELKLAAEKQVARARERANYKRRIKHMTETLDQIHAAAPEDSKLRQYIENRQAQILEFDA